MELVGSLSCQDTTTRDLLAYKESEQASSRFPCFCSATLSSVATERVGEKRYPDPTSPERISPPYSAGNDVTMLTALLRLLPDGGRSYAADA